MQNENCAYLSAFVSMHQGIYARASEKGKKWPSAPSKWPYKVSKMASRIISLATSFSRYNNAPGDADLWSLMASRVQETIFSFTLFVLSCNFFRFYIRFLLSVSLSTFHLFLFQFSLLCSVFSFPNALVFILLSKFLDCLHFVLTSSFDIFILFFHFKISFFFPSFFLEFFFFFTPFFLFTYPVCISFDLILCFLVDSIYIN